MARLPFDPSTLSAGDLALYDEMATRRKAQGASFGGPYAALMNHPQLCKRVEDLGFFLKFQGYLPREVYQFIVLAVARETGAALEWADHVAHARAEGVPEGVIGALQTGGGAHGGFPQPYGLVADVLVQTFAWKNIPQSTQDAAIGAFGMEGFIEIVVTSGFYQMFSAINQGLDVALPESATPV